jgi:hypothetical protein
MGKIINPINNRVVDVGKGELVLFKTRLPTELDFVLGSFNEYYDRGVRSFVELSPACNLRLPFKKLEHYKSKLLPLPIFETFDGVMGGNEIFFDRDEIINAVRNSSHRKYDDWLSQLKKPYVFE